MSSSTYPKRLIEVDLPIKRISSHAPFRDDKVKHFKKRWVLAFGADAEVLAPEDLRQEIAADLGSMVKAYSRKS